MTYYNTYKIKFGPHSTGRSEVHDVSRFYPHYNPLHCNAWLGYRQVKRQTQTIAQYGKKQCQLHVHAHVTQNYARPTAVVNAVHRKTVHRIEMGGNKRKHQYRN